MRLKMKYIFLLTAILVLLCTHSPAATYIFEAEDAVTDGPTFRTNYAGYSGTGSMLFNGDSLSGLDFTVPAYLDGDYPLTIRYLIPTASNDKINDIFVNTVSIGNYNFLNTGGLWTSWAIGDISLNAGDNTIRIQHNWGWIYVDYIAIEGLDPLARYPVPANHTTVSSDLGRLCWTNPDPGQGDSLTCDVYLGTDPNGVYLDLIASVVDANCVTIPTTLDFGESYYWKVDCWDSNGGAVGGPQSIFLPGQLWDFTIFATPCQAAKADPDFVLPKGDINEDCRVNINDAQLFAQDWLNTAGFVNEFIPVNPNASNDAKLILNYIGNMKLRDSKRVLVAEHTGNNNTCQYEYDNMVAPLAEETGKWLGMIGGDDSGTDASAPALIQHFIQYWLEGGLVTMSVHMDNPWTGGSQYDYSPEGHPFLEIIDPNSEVYPDYMALLDNVASLLQELEDAGVVVLWRPFHEMNGHWFWWCDNRYDHTTGPTPQEFQQLWRHMYNYYTSVKGLDNLLWVFSPSANQPLINHYPGAAYVDITGMDIYIEDLNDGPYWASNYAVLQTLGKPFGLTEFGVKSSSQYDYSRIINQIQTEYFDLAFIMCWSGDMFAYIRNSNYYEFMNHPWAASRQDVRAALNLMKFFEN
jgi:beta-mannanase